MNSTRAARYAIFGLVYFAEGAILSYFTALNSLYLLSIGYRWTFMVIAALNLLALPLLPLIFPLKSREAKE